MMIQMSDFSANGTTNMMDCASLLKTGTVKRLLAHLAIDIGGKRARSAGFRLVRMVKQIAVQAAKHGETVSVRYGSDCPPNFDFLSGINVGLHGIVDEGKGPQIVWSIKLYSGNGIPAIKGKNYQMIGLRKPENCQRSYIQAGPMLKQARKFFRDSYNQAVRNPFAF